MAWGVDFLNGIRGEVGGWDGRLTYHQDIDSALSNEVSN